MPLLRLAAVLAVLFACCAATTAVKTPTAHERACGAAFGVLQRCAAAGGSRDDVRARCCDLLDSFSEHGCLCPGCPLGASAGATSTKGEALSAQLEPLMALCGYGVADSTQQPDEDDAMADMAGLAAAAQDPRNSRTFNPSRRPGEGLGDTPAHDYDNSLSDADAAFMLVDPAAARAYAERAAAQVARGAEDEEEAASAGAVDDAGDGEEEENSAVPVLLASPSDVPRTAEQRRAEALAAAVEAQQEAHLQAHRLSGLEDGASTSKLSFDIEVDIDNPEAARRVTDSIAAVLSSWKAAVGSATNQAELAAALEDTAHRMAAAASSSGALGRAGLQPKQLLLQQVEVQRLQRGGTSAGSEHKLCACMNVDVSLGGDEAGLVAALRRRYVAARLALCRFACTHQQTLGVLLAAELVLCAAWLAVWQLHGSATPASGDDSSSRQQSEQRQQDQFMIASAADPQWQAELKQPLLGSGISSC